MLEITSLEVHYGVVPALKGVTFSVKQGEIVSLVGSNGSGKTTALNAISGLVKASGGSMSFCGTKITGKPAYAIVKMGICQVPEGRGIFPDLTVLENLNLGAYLRNDKSEIKKDRDEVYELFPRLREREKQSAGTLSGGEQQMLAIGRALLARPKLLLLDEPSMGLAPILVDDIFRTIRHINKKNATTILLVEQNARIALTVSHKTYVMETGKIVLEGDSQELLNNDKIRRLYLGE
jgi:branched-chain amino acid transport system ATP-binding protein